MYYFFEKAIALCHNVTPVYESEEQNDDEEYELTEADQQSQQQVTYQASSPDEACILINSLSVFNLQHFCV